MCGAACLYGQGVYSSLEFVVQDRVDHAMTLNQFLPWNTVRQAVRRRDSQSGS